MKTIVSTCAPGPLLFENGFDKAATRQWCNAHINFIGSPVCKRAAITVDTEHPMYGRPATLHYPSDSYPYVVVGGSKSGQTLVFARVRGEAPQGEGRDFTSQEALDLVDYRSAMRLRASGGDKHNRYGPDRNMIVGYARYYNAREL